MPLEQRTMRKIHLRILPLLALALLFSWLDKINIGFAALQMNEDLGFSKADFGLGAGFFSVGYILFAIPGTLMLKRYGARRWVGLVLMACGIFSAATAFVTTAQELFIIRALLGAAEASIAPGMILFLSYWLPIEQRGRAWSFLLLVNPIALTLGGPISAVFLGFDGFLGKAGWQWLFLMEALPTFAIAVLIFMFLKNRPTEANWLSAEERDWLKGKLAAEQEAIQSNGGGDGTTRQAFTSGRIWILTFSNFTHGVCGAGPIFFFPLIIHSMGFSTMDTGLLVMVPAIVGGLSLPVWGYLTDRAVRKESVLAVSSFIKMFGLLAAGLLLPSPWALLGLCIALIGMFGGPPSSAMIPYSILRAGAIPAAIGIISAATSLGSFGGAYLIGRLADITNSFSASLLALSGVALLSAISALILLLLHRPPANAILKKQPS